MMPNLKTKRACEPCTNDPLRWPKYPTKCLETFATTLAIPEAVESKGQILMTYTYSSVTTNTIVICYTDIQCTCTCIPQYIYVHVYLLLLKMIYKP